MNNLVHILTTPAAQQERKKGMERGRKMDRGGGDKSCGGAESEG